MVNVYISLLIIFAAFGAFCFNLGHRRAHRLVLKALLKGQLAFLAQHLSQLDGSGARLSQDEIEKAQYSGESIGQLVIGWYKYFSIIPDDKELRELKARIKKALEDYFERIEAAKIRG
jgi:hypothetical protein